MRPLGCRRFGRLLSETQDRGATPRERAFLDRHRAACDPCREAEEASSMSLNLLRSAAFGYDDSAPEPAFDRRVLRVARVTMLRDGVRYWSPAFVGGAVAASLLLAAVQVLTKPIAPGSAPGLEASRAAKPSLALNDRELTRIER